MTFAHPGASLSQGQVKTGANLGKTTYEPLTLGTLGARLGALPMMQTRVGGDPAAWQINEVGDGNLNLVFTVVGPAGRVIVKQALPYVRLVGESWPLPLYRAFFEYHALTRAAARDPGSVPEVYLFDEDQALIVMEFLHPHRILRQKLIAGEHVAGLGPFLGNYVARNAFRGSELSMVSGAKKADVALFAGNVDIPAISEALVFTDPYFDAKLNHHTPALDGLVAQLRGDVALKIAVQDLFTAFASNTETLLHGDLHSGSVMSTDSDSRVIDPEFAQYGPMGFDLGMLLANLLMAYLSQPGHRSADDLIAYQDWILSVITACVASFRAEFTHLWQTERSGMLYPACLFEDQGHVSDAALDGLLTRIWDEAMGFCGIEMHRRILSLAHNADFEAIADTAHRARLEARSLMMGRDLILMRGTVGDAAALCALARTHDKRNAL